MKITKSNNIFKKLSKSKEPILIVNDNTKEAFEMKKILNKVNYF